MARNDDFDFDDDLDQLDKFDDFDFDDDFNFDSDDDVDIDEGDIKGRKPIMKSLTKVAKYTADDLKNKDFGDHASAALENVLSDDSRSAVSDIKGMADEIKESFIKNLEPLKGEISETLSILEDHMPKEGKLRNLFNYMKDKVTPEKNYDSDRRDELAEMMTGIEDQVKSVQEQMTLDASYKKNDVDYKKFSISALGQISTNIKIGNEYNKLFNKKSLELQFQTLTVLKDTLATHKAVASEQKKQLEGIIKNTGLPEYVKIKMSERLGQSVTSGLANQITDSLFQGNSPLKLVTDNIIRTMNEKLDSAVNAFSSVNMIGSMLGDSGISKEQMAGMGLGGAIMKVGYLGAGKLLGKKRTNALEAAIQGFAANPNSYLRNQLSGTPQGFFGKLKDKALRMALGFTQTDNRFQNVKLDTHGLKDAAVFDGETHRSINTVIPTLLSKIHNEVKGLRTGKFDQNEELRFDHDTMSFISKSDAKLKLRANIKEDIETRTDSSVKNLIDTIETKLKPVNFKGKKEFLKSLHKPMKAYLLEHGSISPLDLNKREFLKYFGPTEQTNVKATFDMFLELLENDSKKSDVFRSFGDSINAIKTSPAIMNKHSSGMNADLLLDEKLVSVNKYSGKLDADLSAYNKAQHQALDVKTHSVSEELDGFDPYDDEINKINWTRDEFDFDDGRSDLRKDYDAIKDFITGKRKPKAAGIMDLQGDVTGNALYSKGGMNFIVDTNQLKFGADYELSYIISDFKYKVLNDEELKEIIIKLKSTNNELEINELIKKAKDILGKYIDERENKINSLNMSAKFKNMISNLTNKNKSKQIKEQELKSFENYLRENRKIADLNVLFGEQKDEDYSIDARYEKALESNLPYLRNIRTADKFSVVSGIKINGTPIQEKSSLKDRISKITENIPTNIEDLKSKVSKDTVKEALSSKVNQFKATQAGQYIGSKYQIAEEKLEEFKNSEIMQKAKAKYEDAKVYTNAKYEDIKNYDYQTAYDNVKAGGFNKVTQVLNQQLVKVKSDIDKKLKSDKNKEILAIIDKDKMTQYFKESDIKLVNKILNADKDEVKEFLRKKYKIETLNPSTYAEGKMAMLVEHLDKIKIDVKNKKQEFKEKLDEKTEKIKTEFNSQKEKVNNKYNKAKKQTKQKYDDIKENINNKTEDIKEQVKTQKEKIQDEYMANVFGDMDNIRDALHASTQSLKSKIFGEYYDELKQKFEERKKEEDKKEEKEGGGLLDKIFGFKKSIMDFLNPLNLVRLGGKGAGSYVRGLYKFATSDFAKNMRAKERAFYGKLLGTAGKGIWEGIKAIPKVPVMAGKGFIQGLTGAKNVATSDFAKATRSGERKTYKTMGKFAGSKIGKVVTFPFKLAGTGFSKLANWFRNKPEDLDTDDKLTIITDYFVKKQEEEATEKMRNRVGGWRSRLKEKKVKDKNTGPNQEAPKEESWLSKIFKNIGMIVPAIIGLGSKLLGGLTSLASNIVGPIVGGITNLAMKALPLLGSGIITAIKGLGSLLAGLLGKAGMSLPFGGGDSGKGKKNKKNKKGKNQNKKKPKNKKPTTKGPKFGGRFGKVLSFGTMALGAIGIGSTLFGGDDEEDEDDIEESSIDMTDVSDVKMPEYYNTDGDDYYQRYGEGVEVEEPLTYVKQDPLDHNPKIIARAKADYIDKESEARTIAAETEYFIKNKVSMFPNQGARRSYKENIKSQIAKELANKDIKGKELTAMVDKAEKAIEVNTAKYKEALGKDLTESEKSAISGKITGGYDTLPEYEKMQLEKDIEVIAKAKARAKEYKDYYDQCVKKGQFANYTRTSTLTDKLQSLYIQELKEKWCQSDSKIPTHEERLQIAKKYYKEADIWLQKANEAKAGKGKMSDTDYEALSKGDYENRINEKKETETQEDKEDKPSIMEAGVDALGTASMVSMFVPSKIKEKIASGAKSIWDKAKNFISGKPNVPDIQSPSTVSKAIEVGNTASKSSGFFGSIWDKAKNAVNTIKDTTLKVGGKIVDGAKAVASAVIPEKVKKLAKSIIDTLKSFKARALKKLGQKAGLKLVARIGAKIAARLVPGAGWALLVADAVEVLKWVLKNGLTIAGAISMVILGFNILDDDSQAVDEDGNPIQPDDEDPDPEKTKSEYYKEVEKIENENDIKDNELDEKDQKDNGDSSNIMSSNDGKDEALKDKALNNKAVATDEQTEYLKQMADRVRERRLRNAYENKFNNDTYASTSNGYGRYVKKNEPVVDTTKIDFNKREKIDGEDPKLNDKTYLSQYFNMQASGDKISGLTGWQKFLMLNPDFKAKLLGFAQDYQALTGKKVQINSAYRPFSQQADLRRRLGSGKAAAPGISHHQYTTAADIQWSEDKTKAAKDNPNGIANNIPKNVAEKLLDKWELDRPLWGPKYKGKPKNAEDWHVQPKWVAEKTFTNPLTKKKETLDSFRTNFAYQSWKQYGLSDQNIQAKVEEIREGGKLNTGVKGKTEDPVKEAKAVNEENVKVAATDGLEENEKQANNQKSEEKLNEKVAGTNITGNQIVQNINESNELSKLRAEMENDDISSLIANNASNSKVIDERPRISQSVEQAKEDHLERNTIKEAKLEENSDKAIQSQEELVAINNKQLKATEDLLRAIQDMNQFQKQTVEIDRREARRREQEATRIQNVKNNGTSQPQEQKPINEKTPPRPETRYDPVFMVSRNNYSNTYSNF